jgi:hypothetical protein
MVRRLVGSAVPTWLAGLTRLAWLAWLTGLTRLTRLARLAGHAPRPARAAGAALAALAAVAGGVPRDHRADADSRGIGQRDHGRDDDRCGGHTDVGFVLTSHRFTEIPRRRCRRCRRCRPRRRWHLSGRCLRYPFPR